MYNWFLRLVFLFCFTAGFFGLFGEKLFHVKLFSSNVDAFYWFIFTYPVMWYSLFLFDYEEHNSDNIIVRVLNTQNSSNNIAWVGGLHIFAFTMYNMGHRLDDLTIHYFFYFLMTCALGYIAFSFIISVLRMFAGAFTFNRY